MSRGTHHVGRVVELPRLSLVVLSGPTRGREYVMEADRLRIGKAKMNELMLVDDTVSREHCEILREVRGYVVRDRGSTNGTLLDGSEIREAFLKPGAILTVGNVELKVRTFNERIEILPSENDSFGHAVGKSVRMREIFGLMERLAPSDVTILLGGETGTGKDVLARSIHMMSPRSEKPFVVVDCGAVVASLIESELFGHEKGAFSGASDQRHGAFELAHGGTLFLDEIGELPLDLQPKLLRAIEQRAFRRVGGDSEIDVDIRIVAATKRNLRAEVERGKFREDLYFRLAVAPVEMPPLRERREDVPMLVNALIESLPEKGPWQVDDTVLATLRGHDWPGNVRELRNVLARAVVMAQSAGSQQLELAPMPSGGMHDHAVSLSEFDPALSYRETKAAIETLFEKQYVSWLLERHEGNISAAARAADMDRKYLHKLAKRHGVHPSDRD